MRVFLLRAPILGSIGERTEWHQGDRCDECGRASRYPEPLHVLINRWDSHHVWRLMWMLLISEPFAESLDKIGHPVPTVPVEQEIFLSDEAGNDVSNSIPPFYRVDFQRVLPNRFQRFCPACSISFITDSTYIRLPTGRRTRDDEEDEDGMTRDAMLFDTDLDDLEPIFSVGRQMIAVTEPIARMFDTTPEIRLQEIPIQKNPIGNIQRPDMSHDW